jgi:hypothetical protein
MRGRHSSFRPQLASPQRGSVMEDSLHRLFAVVAAGPFNLSVKQLVDGALLKTTVTLSLGTLRHTGKRINIEEEV